MIFHDPFHWGFGNRTCSLDKWLPIPPSIEHPPETIVDVREAYISDHKYRVFNMNDQPNRCLII